jgi:hypothetical protein
LVFEVCNTPVEREPCGNLGGNADGGGNFFGLQVIGISEANVATVVWPLTAGKPPPCV